MEIIFNIEFITGIIFVIFGIYLYFLVKKGRTKFIVRGEVRVSFGYWEAYAIMLVGLIPMGIVPLRILVPELPSWGTIPITVALVLIFLYFRNRNKKEPTP